jgi:hypothetical protein
MVYTWMPTILRNVELDKFQCSNSDIFSERVLFKLIASHDRRALVTERETYNLAKVEIQKLDELNHLRNREKELFADCEAKQE